MEGSIHWEITNWLSDGCYIAWECAILEVWPPLFHWFGRIEHCQISQDSDDLTHFQTIYWHINYGLSNKISQVYHAIICLKFKQNCYIFVCISDRNLAAEPKGWPNFKFASVPLWEKSCCPLPWRWRGDIGIALSLSSSIYSPTHWSV